MRTSTESCTSSSTDPVPTGALARLGLAALTSALAACGDGAASSSGHRAPTPATAAPIPPDPPDLRVDRATALVVAGQYDAAEALLEAVLEDHPGHGKAELTLGLCEHKRKHYARALPHFERVLARGPTFEGHPTVHYWLGWCFYYLGEPAKARASFERHLEHDPDEGDSHFALGLLDLEEGALSAALGRFERSIELHRAVEERGGPSRAADIAKAHARSADAHLLRDDLAAAKTALEQCVALHPAHYAAYYKLNEVLRRLGDHGGAQRALQLHELWKRRAQGS